MGARPGRRRAGLRWYGDSAHEARVVGDLVVARGENDFAPFVSAGHLFGYSHQLHHAGDGERHTVTITKRTLTLARRYLDPGDRARRVVAARRRARGAQRRGAGRVASAVDVRGNAREKMDQPQAQEMTVTRARMWG